MHRVNVQVINPTGLHARPASSFAKCAAKFKSEIKIARLGENEFTNAKSVVKLLTLGLEQHQTAIIQAEGEDEQEAVSCLAALIEDGFGEL